MRIILGLSETVPSFNVPSETDSFRNKSLQLIISYKGIFFYSVKGFKNIITSAWTEGLLFWRDPQVKGLILTFGLLIEIYVGEGKKKKSRKYAMHF